MKVQFRDTEWRKQKSTEVAVAEQAGCDAVLVPMRKAESRTPASIAAPHGRDLSADLRQTDPQKLGRSALKRSLSLAGGVSDERRRGCSQRSVVVVSSAGHRGRLVRATRFAPGAVVTAVCRAVVGPTGGRPTRSSDLSTHVQSDSTVASP